MIAKNNFKKGFTLIEAVIALSIFSAVVVSIGAFQRDVFFFNNVLQIGLNNVSEARKILRPFIGEVRGAQPSNLGSSAIVSATEKSFVFYTIYNIYYNNNTIYIFFLCPTFFLVGLGKCFFKYRILSLSCKIL